MNTMPCNVQLQILSEGYDRKTNWFQPRVAVAPPTTAVLTMTPAQLWASDIFTAVHAMWSDDLGRTWSAPRPVAELDRRAVPGGFEACPADMTPVWHAASGRLLATGGTGVYLPGEKGALVVDERCRRDVSYSVCDPATRAWTEWQTLALPDADRYFHAGAGCTQRVDLPDGTILLPVYSAPRDQVIGGAWKTCYAATVFRCDFDGRTLRVVEAGAPLTVSDPRGFCEPSLIRFEDRFLLTLRNDIRAYVAASRDGLHFDPPVPWRFDDGAELGSYNTQQHWLTCGDALFLTYTRRGANNDEVIRHRAPLFICQVDPDRLCLARATERELAPNRGAQLGNFGTASISQSEAWVVTSEGMLGDAKDPFKLELTERRGANGRVYLCRVKCGG